MRDFQYHAPTSLKDVYALLGEHGEDSRLISGGTGLINICLLYTSPRPRDALLSRMPSSA